MNKKDLSEIRKNFTDTSPLFDLEHVLTAYVDADKNIHGKENKLYALMPEDKGAIIMSTLKKVLSGTLGKNLVEYAFPSGAYDDDGAQQTLYNAVSTKLSSDTYCDELLDMIVKNLDYSGAYTVMIGCCSYSITYAVDLDEPNGTDDMPDIYRFLVAAVRPAETENDGLMYDDNKNEIINRSRSNNLISIAPSDGFLFPVFSGRCPDVNSVMYYSKNAKKPNISIIEDVLGCTFSMTAEQEKDAFRQILSEVVGDDMSSSVINSVNDSLRCRISSSKNDTELPKIDAAKMKTILSEAGVSDPKLNALDEIFKKHIGRSEGLTAENITESNIIISTLDVTVKANISAADKIRAEVSGGRRRIVIDVNEPSVEINDIPVYLK